MPPASHPLFLPAAWSWDRFSPLTDFGVFFSTQVTVLILIADLRLNIHLSDHRP